MNLNAMWKRTLIAVIIAFSGAFYFQKQMFNLSINGIVECMHVYYIIIFSSAAWLSETINAFRQYFLKMFEQYLDVGYFYNNASAS